MTCFLKGRSSSPIEFRLLRGEEVVDDIFEECLLWLEKLYEVALDEWNECLEECLEDAW